MEDKDIQAVGILMDKLGAQIEMLQQTMDAKFERLKAVIMAYLEAESSMSLATVRANLKAV